MFRIGEVALSNHVIKAQDVHIGINKAKLMFVLHSSKTHNKGDHPQIVKIASSGSLSQKQLTCPFHALQSYVNIRNQDKMDDEPFFLFMDRSPVMPQQYRRLLKDLILRNKLNPAQYGMHCMRAGRSLDLLAMGVLVETIKKLGRWKSTSVYSYF